MPPHSASRAAPAKPRQPPNRPAPPPAAALGGGPIGSAECVTDDAGRPDAVGATLDIDRECDDSTGEVVANTLTDIVAGVDGVVGDSAGYMVKCTERKVKGVTRRGNSTSAFTTYAKYSFRC